MNERHVHYEDGTVGQVAGMVVPRYADLTTFARLPRAEDVDDFDVAVVGLPFDSGVTYRPGAGSGRPRSDRHHGCSGPTTPL